MPRRTATSAPMPFAQKPSIFLSSSAFAAVTPKFTPAASAPGTGAIFTPSRARSMPASTSRRRSPISTQGAAPMLRPFTRRDVAARDAEVAAHHQEPVHALGLGAEELDALPLRKRRQRRMRGAADEIDRAVAQRHVGLVDRKDQLDLDVEPFLLEESELRGGNRREVRIRDHVGDGEFHGVGFDAWRAGERQGKSNRSKAPRLAPRLVCGVHCSKVWNK